MSELSQHAVSDKPSELKKLLKAAIGQGFTSLILTNDLSDDRPPIRGHAPNGDFTILEGGGDHEAAFAELGLPLPIDMPNGAGWVVFDGNRIEYQALRVVPQDDLYYPAWELVFHVAKPCEFPAVRYRPDIVL